MSTPVNNYISLTLKPNINSVFSINTSENFNQLALSVFKYQADNNEVYKQYLNSLRINIDEVKEVAQIPFLPVEFFKTHKVVTNSELQTTNSELFLSSGTTDANQSKHYVSDVNIYEMSYQKSFQYFYGNIEEYCMLALLPSYLEREGSSLIYMVADLIKKSKHPQSGFYLNNYNDLLVTLKELDIKKQKTILLGVSYALLDLADQLVSQKTEKSNFKNTIVMETGGMKGKRQEMIKEELHNKLCKSFGVEVIHSEYGMTELLSQAYSKGKGLFECPPWMKILIRDVNDPFTLLPAERSGGINIIDLANINSCSFIATHDLGKLHFNNSFEVLGRFDNSDIRGCNLLLQ